MLTTHLEDYFLIRASAKSTQVQYRIAAKLFDDWASRHDIETIDDISELSLSRFLQWYETQVGPNTVRSKRRTLLAILAFIGIDLNARRVRNVRKSPKLVESWTPEQCQRIIFAATKLKGMAGDLGTTRADYTACMLAVVLETALRRGDLLAITCAQIRRGRWSHVQSKTGNIVDCRISAITQQRVIAMPHFGDRKPFAEWTKDHKRTLSNLATKAMDAAWLTVKDGKPLQQLRRSSITIQEVSEPGTGYEQAGHTTDTVTKQSYIDASKTSRKRPIADWEPYVA